MFKNHEAVAIVYTNRKKETSERTVVPFNVAPVNVKAIDVTDLPEGEQQQMTSRMLEYQEYLEIIRSATFKFEDWLEMTHAETPDIKWRTFDPANVNFL